MGITGAVSVARAAGQHFIEAPYDGAAVVLSAFDTPCFLDDRVCLWPLLPGAAPNALEQAARGESARIWVRVNLEARQPG